MAYYQVLFIDFYLHSKFHLNWKNCGWTDGQTVRPALLG